MRLGFQAGARGGQPGGLVLRKVGRGALFQVSYFRPSMGAGA